jgi:hypothetical protein
MEKFRELFLEYREENGILTARKMAQKQRITELIDDLCEEELTTDEKVDKIICVLELMNMKHGG